MSKWILRNVGILYILTFLTSAHAVSFVGLIGTDYQPNHYAAGHTFNDHDVFYVGMNGGTPITNVYAELSQLQAAGFTVVRSYATTEYTWAEIINDANTLNLNVIYEASIPSTGNSQSIQSAVAILTNVLTATTPSVFKNKVILVYAGHENYNNANEPYICSAIHALQKTTTVPVGNAFLSGDLMAPPSGDISKILNCSSTSAPASFDPYPFQWGAPIATAVTDGTSGQGTINSIQYDYFQVNQNGVAGSRPIFMAESGWATSGTTNPGYACGTSGYPPCAPSVANAASYLTALYAFVNKAANKAGLLAFEAYDEPAKGSSTNMETYYGMFDSDCNLKGPNNTALLPNTNFVPANNHGCQGFSQGALLVVQGGFGHDPLSVSITTNTNPETSVSSPITLNNFSANTQSYNDGGAWPYFMVFTGATVNISGNNGPAPCTETISSIDSSQNITFSGSCNCTGNVCFF